MDLADDELRDLAAFCARRFPSPTEQAQIAARAGVPFLPQEDPAAAWRGLLHEAQEADGLGRLARVLAAAAPEDRNLQEACAVLVTGDRGVFSRAPVVFVGALLLGGLLAGAWWWSVEREEGASATSAAMAARPVPPPAGPAARTVADPAAAAPAVVTDPPVVAHPPVADAPAVAHPPVAASAVAAPTSAAGTTGCDALTGEVVGYWYAGAAAPGAVGEVVTLDRDARVRADYPRAENQHDARAAERCVLSRGMRVRLSHAPIDASHGHWWVPYAPGDRVQ